ncbi:hypothetical protein HN51_031554 [Arachis hypogaea]
MVQESSYAPEDRLLRAILGIQVSSSKETCLKLPIGGRGRVVDVRWIQKKRGSNYNPETIRIYILQKREIKVGDKVAGRHGNKVTALPLGTIGSLRPTFVPARRVGLAVKLPSAFALEGQSPSVPRKPLHASVTFWEAYAP